jgi:hypothetical protein
MAFPEFTIAAALAIVVLLIPLPVYWRGRNVALLILILTTIIQNLFQFVNTIVWAHSVRDVAPVWCDLCEFLFIANAMQTLMNICSHKFFVVLSTRCRGRCILCLQTAGMAVFTTQHQIWKTTPSLV